MAEDGWNAVPGRQHTNGARQAEQRETNTGNYTFVVVPKKINEPFFDMVGEGCKATGEELGNVDCRFIGPDIVDAQEQAAIIRALVQDPSKYNLSRIDGMSIAVIEENVTQAAIDYVTDHGIPVITFDADAPHSARKAFISTNNTAFGMELGKVLHQLRPEGGGYAMMTGSGPNLVYRLDGVREALKGTNWREVLPPLNCRDNVSIALEQMKALGANPNVNAAIPIGGWPMFNPDPTPWKTFAGEYKNLTTVVADSSDTQILLMNQGYVDGLVGQLPFQMGNFSAQALLNITQGRALKKDYFGTHLLEILRVPLVLPPVHVNNNNIGGLAYLGYSLFAIIGLLAVGFSIWTLLNRNTRVVKASQPAFMVMICAGVLVLGSAIIPLSIDDENYSTEGTDIACKSIPWLMTLGFCTMFSALLSKTWRIVKILEKAQRFERVKITAKDVLAPYFALLAVNVITLICWTAINPLIYVRRNHLGRDGWNRVISTYGGCVSSSMDGGGAVPYLVIITVVNGGLLVIANVMAYRARNIRTEFSESRFITIVMASMLQAGLIGIPIVFLVLDQPQPYYVVMIFLIFVVCMATLLFMFFPKVQALKNRNEAERQKSQRAGRDNNLISNSTDDGEAGLKVARLDNPDSTPKSFAKRKDLSKHSETDFEGANGNRSQSRVSEHCVDELATMIENLSEEERRKLLAKFDRPQEVDIGPNGSSVTIFEENESIPV